MVLWYGSNMRLGSMKSRSMSDQATTKSVPPYTPLILPSYQFPERAEPNSYTKSNDPKSGNGVGPPRSMPHEFSHLGHLL
jgi:hypothetical protein